MFFNNVPRTFFMVVVSLGISPVLQASQEPVPSDTESVVVSHIPNNALAESVAQEICSETDTPFEDQNIAGEENLAIALKGVVLCEDHIKNQVTQALLSTISVSSEHDCTTSAQEHNNNALSQDTQVQQGVQPNVQELSTASEKTQNPVVQEPHNNRPFFTMYGMDQDTFNSVMICGVCAASAVGYTMYTYIKKKIMSTKKMIFLALSHYKKSTLQNAYQLLLQQLGTVQPDNGATLYIQKKDVACLLKFIRTVPSRKKRCMLVAVMLKKFNMNATCKAYCVQYLRSII